MRHLGACRGRTKPSLFIKVMPYCAMCAHRISWLHPTKAGTE